MLKKAKFLLTDYHKPQLIATEKWEMWKKMSVFRSKKRTYHKLCSTSAVVYLVIT